MSAFGEYGVGGSIPGKYKQGSDEMLCPIDGPGEGTVDNQVNTVLAGEKSTLANGLHMGGTHAAVASK